MSSSKSKAKYGLMDSLISELLSSDSESVLGQAMLADNKIARGIPFRYRIIAAAFISKASQ